ncbi:MAG: SDR family oxidoreductase [Ectothiorhodospiraceae bacterium]|nr:SDR family oxidoreductase [Ectothiorhodospiraceae bacterium]
MSGAALVTGASRNIGRGIALALARDGYPVACFGRDRSALTETADLIGEAGGTASVHVGDASSDTDLEVFARDAAERHGGIAAVVNNAGVMREARVGDTTPDAFREVINVNLVAAFVLARAAYPHLRERGGVVINIGSMFASLGVPAAASYCASKAGIEGLTRSLAAEWGRDGIRVVNVAPGYVRSDISAAALDDPALAKRILSRIPLKRVSEPEEIGDLVAFLASPRAGFMTGETVMIDGGQRMHV